MQPPQADTVAVVVGDLTGDGKPEIVCPGYNATNLSVYQKQLYSWHNFDGCRFRSAIGCLLYQPACHDRP